MSTVPGDRLAGVVPVDEHLAGFVGEVDPQRGHLEVDRVAWDDSLAGRGTVRGERIQRVHDGLLSQRGGILLRG